jgi:hydroxyethylthiazole kinase
MTPTCASLPADVARAARDVRERAPLVQCLTNEVTTNLVASALLAAGASPTAVSAPGEAEELAAVAGAVLVNLGTLSTDQRATVPTTVATARAAGTPWVLDPVAVSVLSRRTRLARELLASGPAVVRGNASEVRALTGEGSGGRGVDATDTVDAAGAAAARIAARTGGTVAVSGAIDWISDGMTRVRVAVGHPLLASITGAGCALGGLTAAYCAVADPLTAAVGATAALGTAAEVAARDANGPASFQVALIDALHDQDPDALHERVRDALDIAAEAHAGAAGGTR